LHGRFLIAAAFTTYTTLHPRIGIFWRKNDDKPCRPRPCVGAPAVVAPNMERRCESGLNQPFDQPFDEDVNGDMLYVWFLETMEICYMLNQEFPTVIFDENMLCCILSPTWYEIWMSENEGLTLWKIAIQIRPNGKCTVHWGFEQQQWRYETDHGDIIGIECNKPDDIWD
jgi:hypothetical protein